MKGHKIRFLSVIATFMLISSILSSQALAVARSSKYLDAYGTYVSPVGNGKIVFTNENQIYTRHDPTFHGEAGLIREFCAKTSITDLHDYTLYSSCEPCFMCSGAMVWVKLGRLVYGASNSDLEAILGNEGCNCSKIVFDTSFWQPQVTAGILRDESLMILKDYFDTHAKG